MYIFYIKKRWAPPYALTKLLMIMRFIILILITAIMQVSASSFGQKITLSEKDSPLIKVFDKIRAQSGVDFLVSTSMLENARRVSIQVNNAELEDVLNRLFEGQALQYVIHDKSVVVSKKIPSFLDRVVARFQAIDVRGKILDEKGQPLVGATVAIKGKNRSVKTDQNGVFYLDNVGERDKLVISFIGYQNREVDAASDMGSLTMVLADAKLEEVIVNAGYYTVKDSERTGSISRITSKDIETQPVTNVLATMQGRMAGINITQTTGIPGGGFEIAIRGVNSLRSEGNRPLFIIDGMPYASDPIGVSQNSTVLPTASNPLNSINPDQIESIEVLKDADATAIYGSRGANGVVLVTTKRGEMGRTKVTAEVSTGAGTVTRFMDLMNTEQYLAMRQEAFTNDGFDVPPEEAYDINGTWDRTRQTDWQNTLFGNKAWTTNTQLSVSGGNEQTQFLLSGNFNKQTTVLEESFAYKKTNVFLSLGHSSVDKKFHIDFSTSYTVQNNNQPRLDILNEVLGLAPNAPTLRNADGSLNWENSTWENPIREYAGHYGSTIYDLMANTNISYRFAKGFILKSNFGYSTAANDELTTSPSTRTNPAFGKTSQSSGLYVGNTDRKSWLVEPQVQWNKDVGKIRLDMLVGASFQSQNGSQLAQYASGFTNNSLIYSISSAAALRTSISNITEYNYQAFFGRVNVAMADKYFLNLTGRRDGSSRFGPGKQFANFGALGGAWVFSKEEWLSDNRIISFGKLRASYGITGNDQIGDYQFLDTYNSTGITYDGVVGIQPTRLFNPEFSWETNRKFEVAFEAGLLKDRIFLSVGWYNNLSGNQLTGIPLPGTTGFPSILANLDATVQNRGVELMLRIQNIKRQHFHWTSSFNLSIERNKLIKFPDLDISTYKNTYVIGKPLLIKKLYYSEGVDPETGLYTFTDVNKDGRFTTADDKKTIVDFSPDYYGGFQNELTYKNWRFNFLFQFIKQLNYNSVSNFNPPGTSNQPASILNHWRLPGDIAEYQRYTAGYDGNAVNAYYRYMESDAAVSNASFVRLKNISLSYNLPAGRLSIIKYRFFAEAQNLLTFTKFSGADPEFMVSGYLPPLKVISGGVQLQF